MNTKEKQALNEKIAKWCGFNYLKYLDSDHTVNRPDHLLVYYSGSEAVPNFCDSMDALIKWATPSLRVWRTDSSNYITLAYVDNFPDNYANASDKSPSLALSLAIEKLIKEQGENK
jgi:hypothetical protein